MKFTCKTEGKNANCRTVENIPFKFENIGVMFLTIELVLIFKFDRLSIFIAVIISPPPSQL